MFAAMVAVPVRNEGERIGRCLDALHVQRGAPRPGVVLLLDRCTDDTAAIAAHHPCAPILLASNEANGSAGLARRLAMDEAARLAGPSGVILTTDADAAVPPDWLARNLAGLRAGADLVAGRAAIDPTEALLIPQALHDADAAECAYAAALDEIASLLDPDPADPWPRHTEASGASLALTAAAYRAAGGLPRVSVGEDRALVLAISRRDGRVRHDPDIAVIVSGRVEGRAAGGMADTIRRRMVRPDEFIDDRLEPARSFARRADLRRRARLLYRSGAALAGLSTLPDSLGLSPEHLTLLLGQPFFGRAWDAVEAASPALARLPVAVATLPAQMRAAGRILAGLRGEVTPSIRPAGRSAPSPSLRHQAAAPS